jgi:hypothetical protein
MTDPEHRRRGLLTAVGEHAYRIWREAGISFVIGLPNQQWGSRAAALGWQELFALEWRVRPLRPERIAARRTGWSALSHLRHAGNAWNYMWRWSLRKDPEVSVRRVREPDAVFDRLWAIMQRERAPSLPRSIVRNGEWVAWRYLAAPDLPYVVHVAERHGVPLGYCVSIVRITAGRRTAYLPEFVFCRNDDAGQRTLLAEVIDELACQDAESIASLVASDTSWDRLLARAGFLRHRGSFSIQVVPLQTPVLPGSWEVFGGDFDVL